MQKVKRLSVILSGAKDLHLLVLKEKLQILRSAQDDRLGGKLFRSLLARLFGEAKSPLGIQTETPPVQRTCFVKAHRMGYAI